MVQKNSMIKILYIIFGLLLFGSVLAVPPELNLDFYKKITPEIVEANQEVSKPKKFYTSNNLARYKGGSYFASGDPLLVEIKILDINGVPIDGAFVRLWQTNAFGVYNYNVNAEDPNYDPYFTGSGATYSNNLGKVVFNTVFPKPQKGSTAKLNISLSHLQYGNLNTVLFFKDYAENEKDKIYKKLTPQDRQNVTGQVYYVNSARPEFGKRVEYLIVLNVAQQYKRF